MQQPINQKQPLFMRWYEEYRERRYLVDAPDEEVIQRALDLMTNALSLTPNGKIGMEVLETPQAAFVMRLYSHALEECRLRTGDYLGLFKKYGVRKFGAPRATAPDLPASADIIRISGEKTKLRRLFKFGKRKWMHEMLNHGTLRVSPASAYDDPSLAPAIADNELAYDLVTEAFDDDIMFLHPYQTRLADVFGSPRSARHRLTLTTNYYVWCASFGLRLRMFDDFDAESVLVIRDAGEFTRRLVSAIRNPLHGWTLTPCAVHYFDPYHPSRETRNVFACKHFKYLYQEEFRYVLMPPAPVSSLEPLTIQLGPLGDIAEVHDR